MPPKDDKAVRPDRRKRDYSAAPLEPVAEGRRLCDLQDRPTCNHMPTPGPSRTTLRLRRMRMLIANPPLPGFIS